MTIEEAAVRLRASYTSASSGDKAVTVHLFGIRHAMALSGLPLKELAARAGLSESYATELRKGVRLAEFVDLKAGA